MLIHQWYELRERQADFLRSLVMCETALCGFRIETVGEGTVPMRFKIERLSHKAGWSQRKTMTAGRWVAVLLGYIDLSWMNASLLIRPFYWGHTLLSRLLHLFLQPLNIMRAKTVTQERVSRGSMCSGRCRNRQVTSIVFAGLSGGK